MLMIGKELTAQQRLHKAVVDIMAHPKHMAIGPVLMIGNKSISAQCPTAYTDGRNEVYGEEFVNGLSDTEFRFLVLHEAYHKLYQHLLTWHHLYKEDAQVANMACDYVINQNIMDTDAGEGFVKFIEGGCLDERFRGMDTAKVYRIIKQEQEQNGGSGGHGAPIDEHGWEDAKSMSDSTKKQLQRDLDSALRQGALLASKAGTGGARNLEDLLQPQVDWREQLREFVQTACTGNDYSTWRRPNRRYVGAGHYLPSGVSETMGELVVAVDTSGSIGSRELSMFLSEVAAVCDTVKPEKLRLLYWDTEVCAEEVYDQQELSDITKSTKPVGGGGTAVECVPKYITKHGINAQAVLVLTDGYLSGSWGDWSSPVMWCILDNRQQTAPVGKTVHIDS